MPEGNRVEAAEFWRCGACGTPNPWAAYLTCCLGCGAPRPARPQKAPPRGWLRFRFRVRPWSRSRARPRDSNRRSWGWVALTCWVYLGLVLALWLVLRGLGDRWWLATLLLYGPRWVWGLPLTALIPAAVWTWTRSPRWPLGAVAVATIVVVGPVMGFCVPWRTLFERAPGPGLRVLTCNVEGNYLDSAALARLIEQEQPDVVMLQEWSGKWAALRRPDWHVCEEGDLCLASRFPIRQVEELKSPSEPWRRIVLRCDLEVPGGLLHAYSIHLATPRVGLESVLHGGLRGVPNLRADIEHRQAESNLASAWVGRASGPLLVAGDFNLTTDSAIFRRSWARYRDAFSWTGLGFGHTKETSWFGARIDHVLADPGGQVIRCRVGPDVGSDHRPVLAELSWFKD